MEQGWENSLEVLNKLKIGKKLKHIESRVSSVTTSWGVEWSEDFIARDLLQNFFDANQNSVKAIKVKIDGGMAVVTAPAEFHVKELFFLGSNKGADDVGQYGEGFKCASMCLLRDHNVTPIMLSGKDVVYMRVAKEPVKGTSLYPLVYDFFEDEKGIDGSRLVLDGCSKKLSDILSHGMKHFFHEGNSLVGNLLWSNDKGDYAIYKSKTANGHIFYGKLKRGDIIDIPLILVINKKIKKLEDKIANDRDRKAFGESLLSAFYSVFVRNGIGSAGMMDADPCEIIIKAAKKCWIKGHPLLQLLAECYSLWGIFYDEMTTEYVFGRNHKYYAKYDVRHCDDSLQRMAIMEIEDEWKKDGKIALPGYFVVFGVSSSMSVVKQREIKALEAREQAHKRRPNKSEMDGIALLKDAMMMVSPPISLIFEKRKTQYFIIENDDVMGEMKRKRAHFSADIFLSAPIFTGEFSQALTVFLHEHAHIYGYDGGRSFTDALTDLLENTIKFRSNFDKFEQAWGSIKGSVVRERAVPKGYGAVHEHIMKMKLVELRNLVGYISRDAVVDALSQMSRDIVDKKEEGV